MQRLARLIAVALALALAGALADPVARRHNRRVVEKTFRVANGTTLAATSGTFTSPNYPNAYYDDWRSWWSASAADGQIFRITFTDFSVEDWFDELTIYDGPSTGWPVLAVLSGSSLPAPVYTTRPDFYAVFETDGWGNGRGFRAVYEALGTPSQPEPEPEPDQQVFTSPGYPSYYPNNAVSTWSASTTSGNVLSISFTHFDTEAGYDFLRIYDGTSSKSPLLLEASGAALPATVRTTGTDVYAVFTSDDSETRQGFRGVCEAVSSAPPKTTTTTTTTPAPKTTTTTTTTTTKAPAPPTGSERFASPNFPDNYPDNTMSTWSASTTSGNVLSISFTSFDTEAGYDFLRIYDGTSSKAPLLLEASGSALPDSVSTTGPDVFAVFTSDDSENRSGFEGYYKPKPRSAL